MNKMPGIKLPGSKFPQKLVDQEPVYDKKLKIHRPRKVRKRDRYL